MASLYPTGDMSNNIHKLKRAVKSISFAGSVDYKRIESGDPRPLLELMHYALLDYSPYVAKLLAEKEYQLYGKSDYKFLEGVFKLMIEEFQHKPGVSVKQFLSGHFGERKAILTYTLLHSVRRVHTELREKDRKKRLQWKHPTASMRVRRTLSDKDENRAPQQQWSNVNLGKGQHELGKQSSSKVFVQERRRQSLSSSPDPGVKSPLRDSFYSEPTPNSYENLFQSPRRDIRATREQERNSSFQYSKGEGSMGGSHLKVSMLHSDADADVDADANAHLTSSHEKSAQHHPRAHVLEDRVFKMSQAVEKVADRVESLSKRILHRFDAIEDRLYNLEVHVDRLRSCEVEKPHTDSSKKFYQETKHEPHMYREQHVEQENHSSSNSQHSNSYSNWPPRFPPRENITP